MTVFPFRGPRLLPKSIARFVGATFARGFGPCFVAGSPATFCTDGNIALRLDRKEWVEDRGLWPELPSSAGVPWRHRRRFTRSGSIVRVGMTLIAHRYFRMVTRRFGADVDWCENKRGAGLHEIRVFRGNDLVAVVMPLVRAK